MNNTPFFIKGIEEAKRISKEKTKLTEPGSLKYLFWGPEKSEQSIVIQFGQSLQRMVIHEIEKNKNFSMLQSGVQKLVGMKKKKDVDLLFKNNKTNVIYYRELKANIELDTEKLPATSDKVKLLSKHLKQTYPNHELDFGVLCLSIYEKDNIKQKKILNKIKQFENSGVNISFAKDIFDILSFKTTDKEYYEYWRKIGKILRS
tara:strand:- start:1259 stop:1867 length:609 start_codon:yes stop_codon:yes gene_type:complete